MTFTPEAEKSPLKVKVSGVQLAGVCLDVPSKVKNKLLYLVISTTKKEAQCLVGRFGFW